MAKRGFILIELLITISIIGLLMAAAAFSLSSSRTNARDTIRFADSITIGKALDVYATVNRGTFPMTTNASCAEEHLGALGPFLPNSNAVPKDPRPESPTSSTINYRKCYTIYRNVPTIVGTTTFADATSFRYLIEIGTERPAPSDLSTHKAASEFTPAITPATSSVRTPYYFSGSFCGTTCP